MGRTFNGSSWLVKSGANPFTAFPLSISVWYRYAAVGGEFYAAGLSTATSNYFLVDVGSGTAYAWAYDGTLSQYIGSSNTELLAPAWNHAVAVFTAAGNRTIYLNGIATNSTTGAPNPTFAGASISVGGVSGNGIVPNGFEIGEVSFWDIVLSAQEVAALYRGASPTRIHSGPKLYYPLDGMVGGHLVNRVRNSTDYTMILNTGTAPVASAHPPVQMPFGVRGAGWLGNLPPPYIPLIASNLAVGSPAFTVPAYTQFPRPADLVASSPVLGQPAAKDKSTTTVFAQTLSGPAAIGWQGRTLRQRFEPGMLSAVNPGGIRASLQFAAGTSGQIDALYIGHASTGSSAPPAPVQSAQHQNGSTSSTTIAVTLPATVGVGNMLCVSIGVADGNALNVVSGVTDDKGNAYALVDFFPDTASSYHWYSFYTLNATNGPQTVTATISSPHAFSSILVDEFSGVASAAALDGNSISAKQLISVSGTDTITTPNITTTANGDLVYSSVVDIAGHSTNLAAGTGFTRLQHIVGVFATEYRLQSSAGVIAGKFSPTQSAGGTPYVNFVMAFKAKAADPYDFDGNQVQLKFSGANTMAVSGAGSVQSDAAAFAYDPTRALIVSAAFSGTQVNLAAF